MIVVGGLRDGKNVYEEREREERGELEEGEADEFNGVRAQALGPQNHRGVAGRFGASAGAGTPRVDICGLNSLLFAIDKERLPPAHKVYCR